MVIYCLCIYLYIINSNTYSLIILPYLYTLFMSLSHSVSPFLSTHWCPLLISHTPFCPAVSFSFLFLQMPSYLSFTSTLPLFPIFQAELCWLFFNATISCQNSSVLSTEFIKSLPTVHHTHSPLCDIWLAQSMTWFVPLQLSTVFDIWYMWHLIIAWQIMYSKFLVELIKGYKC